VLKRISLILGLLLTASVLTACNQTKPDETAATNSMEIYEVHKDGRIHVFYDRALYTEFLQLGETPYRLTRIGEGPNGETIVFGLTKKDKKKGANTPAVKLYSNQSKLEGKFYGETRRHGRVYVFSTFEDMKPVRMFGHPTFFYTEIGSGPKGETVVYVLNKANKKKKPVALINEFKKKNS